MAWNPFSWVADQLQGDLDRARARNAAQERTPPPSLRKWDPDNRQPGEVSTQTYAASTGGKALPKNGVPILQSRLQSDRAASNPFRSQAAPGPTREQDLAALHKGLAATRGGVQTRPTEAARLPTEYGPPAPDYDPAGASAFTQRYLSNVGWGGPVRISAVTGDQWIDPKTVRDIGPHAYELSEWQQDQAQQSYGVVPTKEPTRLAGESYRYGRANLADYETLTPQQQNAMRFNDLLVAAVEADRQAVVAPEAQDPGYQSRVNEMFGTQGGSEVYAPNTMALLEKMEMGKLRGQDLDEYLTLDRAYDVGEIQNLQPWEKTPDIGRYKGWGASAGADIQRSLDQRQIDLAGSVIEKALADTSIRGWNEQARIDTYLGRRPPVEQIPFGWLLSGVESRATDAENDKEAAYQRLYGTLASNSTSNLDELWEFTNAKNFTDADYNELFDYFYARSLDEDRLGPMEGMRTGQQVRDFIGIG